MFKPPWSHLVYWTISPSIVCGWMRSIGPSWLRTSFNYHSIEMTSHLGRHLCRHNFTKRRSAMSIYKSREQRFLVCALAIALSLCATSLALSQSDTWELKAPMTDGRFFTNACELDGKIYVIGGQTENAFPNARTIVEIYDPLTDSWSKTSNLPAPKSGPGVCALNGKIYVMGGRYGDYAFAHSSTVYEFDPTTESWAEKTPMPRRRSFFHLFPVEGKIYAIGGRGYEGTTDLWPTEVDIYDPIADAWSFGAAMLINRNLYAGAEVNGKIYIIAGEKDFTKTPTKTVFEYDVAQNKWSKKKDVPTASFAATAAALNGNIYVMGGLKSASVSDSSLNVTEEYNPETDSWIERADLPIRVAGPCCAAFQNKIYVMGGIPKIDMFWPRPGGCGQVTEVVQVYTPPDAAPYVRYQSYNVNDSEGNNNVNPDAGETVKLAVTLRNIRFGTVNTSAMLRSNDSDVQITGATADFGELAQKQSRSNQDNPFLLSVSSSCDPHFCTFYLDISGNNGYASTDSFQMAIGDVDVLLVDDDVDLKYEDYYTQYRPMARWDVNVLGCPTTQVMQAYADRKLIWFTGNDRENTLTPEEQATLAAFLDGGGNLLITGQDIGYDLMENGSPSDSAFYAQYLHALYVSDNSSVNRVDVCNDDKICEGIPSVNLMSSAGANNQYAPDVISALSPAELVLKYRTNENDISGAALKYKNDATGAKLVYLAFGFEAASGNIAGKLLENILAWFDMPVNIDVDESATPGSFHLYQNYPNPFNPTTTIRYALIQPGHVNVSVYNLSGQLVRTVVDEEQNSGVHTPMWNATDEAGNRVSSGIYLYRIEFTDMITGREAWRAERKML
ncbi:T9SS C-terminal target domain-containing protein, partial [candidate division KSB1 bacterium]